MLKSYTQWTFYCHANQKERVSKRTTMKDTLMVIVGQREHFFLLGFRAVKAAEGCVCPSHNSFHPPNHIFCCTWIHRTGIWLAMTSDHHSLKNECLIFMQWGSKTPKTWRCCCCPAGQMMLQQPWKTAVLKRGQQQNIYLTDYKKNRLILLQHSTLWST